MIARRVVIHGHVQGVGFRCGVVDAAQGAGVSGWVRNRIDGTVEALLQGDDAAVERVIGWCRRGPRGSRVTAVDVNDEPVQQTLSAFDLRPTA
jgi:acylphosphatase